MVIVPVGQQHLVGCRHLVQLERKGGIVADEPEDVGKDRVDQQAAAGVVDQEAGVLEVGDGQPVVAADRRPVDGHRNHALVREIGLKRVRVKQLPRENLQQPTAVVDPERVAEAAVAVVEFAAGHVAQAHAVQRSVVQRLLGIRQGGPHPRRQDARRQRNFQEVEKCI